MSTQIKLHERIDGMHDEMLRSEGHLGGGAVGSLMEQLTSDEDYFEEFTDLLSESDSIVVGASYDDGPRDVADLFDGATEVTDRKIAQVRATVENADDVGGEVVEWLEERQGGEVLAIHW